MKKLLTILCLALVLVLVCTSAMAATKYDAQYESLDAYFEAAWNGIKVGSNTIVIYPNGSDNLATVAKNAPHAQMVEVKATGYKLVAGEPQLVKDPEGAYDAKGKEIWQKGTNTAAKYDGKGAIVLNAAGKAAAKDGALYEATSTATIQLVEDAKGVYYVDTTGTTYSWNATTKTLTVSDTKLPGDDSMASLEVVTEKVDETADPIPTLTDSKGKTIETYTTLYAPATIKAGEGYMFYVVDDALLFAPSAAQPHTANNYSKKAYLKIESAAKTVLVDADGEEITLDLKLYTDKNCTTAHVGVIAAGATYYYKDGDKVLTAKGKEIPATYSDETLYFDEARTTLMPAGDIDLYSQLTVYNVTTDMSKATYYKKDAATDPAPCTYSEKDVIAAYDKDGKKLAAGVKRYNSKSQNVDVAMTLTTLATRTTDELYYSTDGGATYQPAWVAGDGYWRTDDGEKVAKAGDRYSYEDTTYVDLTQKIGVTVGVVVDPHWEGSRKLIEDPTCENGGYWAIYCGTCGAEIDREDVNAEGHVWVWKDVKGQEATCTKDGLEQLVCEHCGATADTRVKKALNHNFASGDTTIKKWIIKEAAGCKENSQIPAPGKYIDEVCTRCGEASPTATVKVLSIANYGKYLAATGVIKDATKYDGHVWDEWVDGAAATCWKAAQLKRWCKVCNKIEWKDKDGSKPLTAKYIATGWNTVDCDAANHPWDFYFTCQYCEGECEAHPDKPAFVKYDSTLQCWVLYCTKDDTEDGAVVASATLLHGELEIIKGQESYLANKDDPDKDYVEKKYGATCELAEYINKRCSVCGNWVAVKIADPTDHNFTDWKVVEEGAKAETKLWERHCTNKNCTKVQVKAQATKPVDCKEQGKEHVLVPVSTTGLKCGVNKNVAQKCANCDYTVTKDYTLEHDWETTVVLKPTCEKAGLALKKCKLCKLEMSEELAKVDHTAGEPIVTPATLEKEGSEVVKCTVCGETLSTKVLPKLVPAPKYTLTAEYSGSTVTGKLAHVEGTQDADTKNIRVTFYIEGNYYMATMAEVAADGTFSVDGVGPITYITVAATGNTSVNPEDYQKIAEAQEIIVD